MRWAIFSREREAHVAACALSLLALAGCGGGPAPATRALPAALRHPIPMPAATPLNPNYSYVSLYAPGIRIVYLKTTLTVPPIPPAFGFISLWPGLDNVEALSSVTDFLQQPLLQWGGVCTDPQLPPYKSWLAEAFYFSQAQAQSGQHGGCNGGSVISVKPGDKLTEAIYLSKGEWKQSVTDVQTRRTSTYNYSAQTLQNQYPDRLNFDVEIWNSNGFNNHIPAITFANTVVGASTPFPSCTLTAYVSPPTNTTTGPDSTSTPVSSNGGKTCSYARITLYPVSKFIQPSLRQRGVFPRAFTR
ncbi:MAG: hypothetical protein JO199_08555 [Candidatus Eremiobacteraeota bacterium]|nr:hypothetical protein [Candidatus Eremiobacteraeota bacterium]